MHLLIHLFLSLYSTSFPHYMLLFPLRMSGLNSPKRASSPGLECSTTGKTVTTKGESSMYTVSASHAYLLLFLIDKQSLATLITLDDSKIFLSFLSFHAEVVITLLLDLCVTSFPPLCFSLFPIMFSVFYNF